MAFKDMFKIAQDANVLKTVRGVVRPVFGIRLARQHSSPEKKAYNVIKFDIPLKSYGKDCNPREALKGMACCSEAGELGSDVVADQKLAIDGS
jgi:hypothetical protein